MGDGARRVCGVAFILKLKSAGIPTTGGRARLVWVPRTAQGVSGVAGSSLKNRQKVDHSDRKAGSFFESAINLDIWVRFSTLCLRALTKKSNSKGRLKLFL